MQRPSRLLLSSAFLIISTILLLTITLTTATSHYSTDIEYVDSVADALLELRTETDSQSQAQSNSHSHSHSQLHSHSQSHIRSHTSSHLAATTHGDPRINFACPTLARSQIEICLHLLPTIQPDPNAQWVVQLDQGELVCSTPRHQNEDQKICSKVYDHIAAVGESWNLLERSRGIPSHIFCINLLAEPVKSRAMLSPRTERKCLGKKTADDDKFDMEPAAPKGYTGNILEDPFHNDIYYLNGCRCECKKGGKRNQKKDCDCGKKKKR